MQMKAYHGEIYQGHDDQWRWRIIAPNGQHDACSGEGFPTASNARRALRRVIAVCAAGRVVVSKAVVPLLIVLMLAVHAQALTPTPTQPPNCPPGATPVMDTCCCCPGDADRSGFINSTDFATVVANYGDVSHPPLGMGDADCNGYVNMADYAAVRMNYGRPCP